MLDDQVDVRQEIEDRTGVYEVEELVGYPPDLVQEGSSAEGHLLASADDLEGVARLKDRIGRVVRTVLHGIVVELLHFGEQFDVDVENYGEVYVLSRVQNPNVDVFKYG